MPASLERPLPHPDAVRVSPEADMLRDVVRLLGGDAGAVEPSMHVPMALRRLDEGAVLSHEGAPLQSLHIVRSGSLKCVRTREDGYEQVTSLALPGDVLGFDGLHGGRHAATEVALQVCTVYALPLPSLHTLRERSRPWDDVWQRALSRQLLLASETADLLTAVAADVRLARFVLWLSARAAGLGWSPRRLRLTLNRRDLASLLGMAHETVSRSFTTMADAGLLRVANREIEILAFAELRARARITRRPAEPFAIVVPHEDDRASPHAPREPARWPPLRTPLQDGLPRPVT